MVDIRLDRMKKYFDYIVIGGGASGCAVTHKLLNANQTVNLIESGYSHHNFLLDVPAGFFKLINNLSSSIIFDGLIPISIELIVLPI